ncbi:MAG: Uracil-DNA glycosylase, family 4 [Jatrophihabitantaceae bacterium]|nr:Uracil-DNA glycosylase, family 4 [Jatrophihabitantaceae bacterium]
MSAAPPGTGWPLDPATARTPVARTALDVQRLARSAADAHDIDSASSVCRACDRLVGWREDVAAVKRRAYAAEPYWGRPTIGFGPPDARLAILGLAPAAHGGNRTGRIFTGDRSGDWLFAALHRAGRSSQAESIAADDGMQLVDTRIVASVRCAPPDNKPTPIERATCEPWLLRELQLLAPALRVMVVLGGFAWNAAWPALASAGYAIPRPRPAFGHGAEAQVIAAGGPITLLGCYHVSQQNTFTGRLTTDMLDAVFARADEIIAVAD